MIALNDVNFAYGLGFVAGVLCTLVVLWVIRGSRE